MLKIAKNIWLMYRSVISVIALQLLFKFHWSWPCQATKWSAHARTRERGVWRRWGRSTASWTMNRKQPKKIQKVSMLLLAKWCKSLRSWVILITQLEPTFLLGGLHQSRFHALCSDWLVQISWCPCEIDEDVGTHFLSIPAAPCDFLSLCHFCKDAGRPRSWRRLPRRHKLVNLWTGRRPPLHQLPICHLVWPSLCIVPSFHGLILKFMKYTIPVSFPLQNQYRDSTSSQGYGIL